jgi:nicotinamidase/pyrazinamidase
MASNLSSFWLCLSSRFLQDNSESNMQKTINGLSLTRSDVLLVVDVQNGFLPGGGLAVGQGHAVIPVINRVAQSFEVVVLTQDWHPREHISFADNHPGKKPYDSIDLPYGRQTLWPVHCVQGTADAELSADLHVPHAQLTLRKGHHVGVDSYSAFLEADQVTPTGLAGYLKEREVRNIYLCGLATDFCVAWSAIDARKFGFNAAVIEDATRAIDVGGSLQKAWSDMNQAGVRRVQSSIF